MSIVDTEEVNADTMTYQVPNTYLRQFFRFLGGDPSLLAGTEQSPQSLAKLDGSNSFRDYCRFFNNAREQLNDPAIGLVLGEVNRLANMHGPLSVVVSQSTDICDCLELLRRFIPLRSQAFRIGWYQDQRDLGLEVRFQQSAGAAHIPVTETLMIALTSIISVVSQRQVEASRLELDYPRPAYAGRYTEAFHAASFRFSQPRLRLLVSRDDAAYRTGADTDSVLRASAIQRCEELLRGVLREQTTGDRLHQIFADNPGHLWALRDIARHMNTSERTLQRRLAAEGSSYKKLYDDWLSDEACKLLRERALSVESIAMLLGYSDVSNFRCAFRRWFGTSPQAYRSRLSMADDCSQ